MTALTTDRSTPARNNQLTAHPVAAAKKIYAGALVCINASGYLTPGATATTLKAAGRAEESVDNSAGADGDVLAQVRRGCFKFANNGSITIAHTLGTAYIVDDQTVAADSGTNTRSVAGTIHEVESDGVWVQVG